MSRGAIYYDLEEIPPAVVYNARARQPDFAEFFPRGAIWPDEIGGEPEATDNPREFGYQQRLMDWIQRLFAALEQGVARECLIHEGNVSLLEIARYRFLFALAEVHQRWLAVEKIALSAKTRLLWVGPWNVCKQMRWLAECAQLTHIDFLTIKDFTASQCFTSGFVQWSRAFLGRIARRLRGFVPQAKLLIEPGTPLLFVEYFPNSAKVLVPVATRLARQFGMRPLWLAARPAVSRSLADQDIKAIEVSQLSSASEAGGSRYAKRHSERLRLALEQIDPHLFDEIGGEVAKRFLTPAIHAQLMPLLAESKYWLVALSDSFARLKPRCVVSTTYSSIVGRATALAAKVNGARSVFVQHGMFPDCDFFTYFCNDYLLLWGDANKRTMIRNSIDESRIRVVGATIYDEWAQGDAPSKSRALSSGMPVKIAYLASRTAGMVLSYSGAKLCLQTVADAASRIPNVTLQVKLHPSDHTEMAPRLLAGRPRVEITRQGRSQDVISQCDLAIVVSSTTGLEACVADKPLIVLQLSGVPEFGPYESYGAAIHVPIGKRDSTEQLASTIQDLLASPKKQLELSLGRQRLVTDLLNGAHGGATEQTTAALAAISRLAAPAAKEKAIV